MNKKLAIIIITLLVIIILVLSANLLQQSARIKILAYVCTQNADRVIIYSRYIYLQEKIILQLHGKFFVDYDPESIERLVYSNIKKEDKE